MGRVTTDRSASCSVENVVVVPRNGLANRLQAWASAAILAQEWQVPLNVVWEPEDVLPATAESLFADSVVREWFSPPELIKELTGRSHDDLPRYLTQRGDVAVLAGHDRGEQTFMPALNSMVSASQGPSSLILIAGGNFHLPATENARAQRGAFYRRLIWSDQVYERVRSVQPQNLPYLGLHIRQTDRSLDAPSSRSLRRALRAMKKRHPEVSSLFISADSPEGLNEWMTLARTEGISPWTLPHIDHRRGQVSGIVDAAADWMILSNALALVYPAASTFSTEAVVASGHIEESLALRADPVLRQARRAKALLRAGVTYPERRKSGVSEG